MRTLTVDEAEMPLPRMIDELRPGVEVVITRADRPVARLTGEPAPEWRRPGPGLCKGMMTIAAEDDEHLEHFAEYMP